MTQIDEPNLDEQIEEAIKDGLSNHTGEWFNGFIAPGLSLTEEQSVDLLFYLSKAKRLTNNIKQLIADEVKKARINELEKAITDTPKQVEYDTITRQSVGWYNIHDKYVDDRIAELQSTQPSNTEGDDK